MDAFEQIVSEIFWAEGYWVRTSVKVALTKEEKRLINRPSSPRWEIDVVAYSAGSNLLRVVECKSYLDSRGVTIGNFEEGSEKSRYKLFSDKLLRDTVLARLQYQLSESGACRPDAEVRLALACGKVASEEDRVALRKRFAFEGWDFFDETWLREKLKALASSGYENQVSAVAAKLLLRGSA